MKRKRNPRLNNGMKLLIGGVLGYAGYMAWIRYKATKTITNVMVDSLTPGTVPAITDISTIAGRRF